MAKRDSKATKEKILLTSMELFSKKGFNGVSVDEIVKSANVNKAMVFYYFKNKDGLYEAVLVNVIEDIIKSIKNSANCCDSVLGELKNFIESFAVYVDKYPHFPSLFLREISNPQNINQNVFKNLKQLFGLLTEILKKGVEEGIFKDIKPMIIHFMIIGTLSMYITTTPLREKAYKEDNLDTCFECDIKDIANYIYKKVLLMLEVNDEEKNICTN